MQEALDRWINEYHWNYILVAGLCRWRFNVEIDSYDYIAYVIS